MNRIDIINGIIGGSPNRLREKYFIKYHKGIYDEIISFTYNIPDVIFKFKVWHWINDKPDYILCKCGNRVSTHISMEDGYRKFCSRKCASNDELLRKGSKETLLKKYGVDHYSKTDEYKSKIIETSLSRYGVTNYSKTNEYKVKSKETCSIKYGVDHYNKTDEYKVKSKKTCLEKYGVEFYTKTDKCKEDIRMSLKEKITTEEYRIDYKISNDEYYRGYVGDGVSEFVCDFGLDHTFVISTDNYFGRKRSNNRLCTICNPISSMSSIKEEMLYNFIESIYKGDIIRNYRDQFEIDIYLSEIKIGFEFNGIFYHSDKFRDKDYHLQKTNFFKERGIRIIHIWEDDWCYKPEIIKSQILNILSLTKNKIYARKCDIREVDVKEFRSFLDKNHIQGFVRSDVKLGLYYDDILVSCMSFDHYEGRSKMSDNNWNLNRFCNILNTNVIGGASRLLNHFNKTYDVIRIISYADKDWSIGDLYYQLGFINISESRCDYKYVVGDKRVHKSRYTKKRLKTDKKESDFMKDLGVNKVYDCGKIKFEKLLLPEF